ncbi:MAG: hypothetical protein ACLFOY_10755 [Desulfatibacillaceae bacterium]
MRKATILLIGLISLGLVASAAWSYDGWGMQRGPGYQGDQWTKEQSEQYSKFLNETKELRKNLYSARSEYMALMHSTDPDPTRARELSGEIYDLEEKLEGVADKYELPNIGPRGRGYGYCPGWGGGSRGGSGPGPGMMQRGGPRGGGGMMHRGWGGGSR